MKHKLFICTFILTAITLTGCTQKSTTPQINTESNNNTESSPISEEQAKEAALTHAGLTSDQITFVKVGIDRDNGKEKYEVEFYTNGRNEYDYEIDLYTGEILDYDYDAENM